MCANFSCFSLFQFVYYNSEVNIDKQLYQQFIGPEWSSYSKQVATRRMQCEQDSGNGHKTANIFSFKRQKKFFFACCELCACR